MGLRALGFRARCPPYSAAPLVTGLSGFRFSIFELTGFRLSDFGSSGFRPSGPVAPYSMAPLVTKHSLA